MMDYIFEKNNTVKDKTMARLYLVQWIAFQSRLAEESLENSQ